MRGPGVRLRGQERSGRAGRRARTSPSERRPCAPEAESLQQRFEEQFWSDELDSYVLALDGRKQPCRVRSSNAGQCLFTGIASFEHAQSVATTLMGESSSTRSWGIRTIAISEKRYNPMSYHNGSVWPHDNAIIAAGLRALRHARTPVVAS